MDESIFLGYYSKKMAYICYNINAHKIIEGPNVNVDDTKSRRIQIEESGDVEKTNDEEIYDKQK